MSPWVTCRSCNSSPPEGEARGSSGGGSGSGEPSCELAGSEGEPATVSRDDGPGAGSVGSGSAAGSTGVAASPARVTGSPRGSVSAPRSPDGEGLASTLDAWSSITLVSSSKSPNPRRRTEKPSAKNTTARTSSRLEIKADQPRGSSVACQPA